MFEPLLEIIGDMLPERVPRHVRQKIAFSIVGQCLYYRVADQVIASLVSEEERLEHYQPQQLADHIGHFCLSAFGVLPPLGHDVGTAEAANRQM
jgi:hypothetical protein